MRNIIKKILKEEVDIKTQEIEFDGFTEPFLIKQFGIYLVQFKGTGKFKKNPETETFIFTDRDNKEYIFNSEVIQKSGNSNFYINLDDLRKKYDIKFKDDFKRYKRDLSTHDSGVFSNKIISEYKSSGRCRTKKCEDYRNTIESILKEQYSNYYGVFESKFCGNTEGFLNYQGIPNIVDDNGNTWSLLNYYIYSTRTVTLLVKSYINENGTFEHNDFIEWIKENKNNYFSESNIEVLRDSMKSLYDRLIINIEISDNVISKFLKDKNYQVISCPSTRKGYTNITSVILNGKIINFQTLGTFKIKKSDKINDNLWVTKLSSPQQIDYKADYIVTTSGYLFKNDKVIIDGVLVYFQNPPLMIVK